MGRARGQNGERVRDLELPPHVVGALRTGAPARGLCRPPIRTGASPRSCRCTGGASARSRSSASSATASATSSGRSARRVIVPSRPARSGRRSRAGCSSASACRAKAGTTRSEAASSCVKGSPLVRLGQASWDDFLALRSANFRQQLRRRERALFRDHEARFRLTSSPSELDRDFSSLVDLHRKRWHDRTSFSATSRSTAPSPRSPSRRDGCGSGTWRSRRPRSRRGSVSGSGRVEAFYQAGRDPSWDHASVGLVLLAHSIRAALEDGMDEYRFLRGAEPYKYRFADEDPGLETIVVAPRAPWAAAGLAGGARLARAARSRIRRLRAVSLRARPPNE